MEFDLFKNLISFKMKVGIAIGVTFFIVVMCGWYYLFGMAGQTNEKSETEDSNEKSTGVYDSGSKGFLQKPVKEGTITATMYYPSGKFHGAIDYGVSVGTPVFAGADGVVVKTADLQNSYGTYVVIQHENGIQTWYAHGTRGSILVSKGQKVTRGQQIMLSGNSGHSTGPHLHYEVRVEPYNYNTCRKNPQDYM